MQHRFINYLSKQKTAHHQRMQGHLAQKQQLSLVQVTDLHPKVYFGPVQYAVLYKRRLRDAFAGWRTSCLAKIKHWQQAMQLKNKQAHTSARLPLDAPAEMLQRWLSADYVTHIVEHTHAIEHVCKLDQSQAIAQHFRQWLEIPDAQRQTRTLAFESNRLAWVLGQWRLYGMIYLSRCFKGVLALSDETVIDVLADGFGQRLGAFVLRAQGQQVALLRVVL